MATVTHLYGSNPDDTLAKGSSLRLTFAGTNRVSKVDLTPFAEAYFEWLIS